MHKEGEKGRRKKTLGKTGWKTNYCAFRKTYERLAWYAYLEYLREVQSPVMAGRSSGKGHSIKDSISKDVPTGGVRGRMCRVRSRRQRWQGGEEERGPHDLRLRRFARTGGNRDHKGPVSSKPTRVDDLQEGCQESEGRRRGPEKGESNRVRHDCEDIQKERGGTSVTRADERGGRVGRNSGVRLRLGIDHEEEREQRNCSRLN